MPRILHCGLDYSSGGGGTEVVANPSGTATADLDTVQIDGTIYDIPGSGGGGTTVVANPSGEATADLDTIQIGETIYDIPGSGGGSSGKGYSTTCIWDYVEDNSGVIPYNPCTLTLNQDINNFESLVIELVSVAGDISSVDWNSTVLHQVDINALNNSYNNNYLTYTSFGERASRFYIKDTTFQKTANNLSNVNGIVRVYGIKYRGERGGSFIDDIIYENTTGVSGSSQSITLTKSVSEYDALSVVYSTYSDGGYSTRGESYYSPVFLRSDSVFYNLWYPTYGNRYIVLTGDPESTTVTLSTGVYGEGSGYTPIVYEVHGIKFGGGGTDVEANPQETPSDMLSTIKIGETTYDISGSGGGSSYEETVIYEASASADTYNLTSSLNNFDAVMMYIKYSGSVQGNYIVTSMFLVDKIETGIYYGVSSDDWYSYFAKTDNTTLTRGNQDKCYLAKIVGINFGGSGSRSVPNTLYKAQSTTRPNTITLYDSLTNYDYIITHIKSSNSNQATIGYIYTVDSMNTGDIIGGELAAGNGWIWYTYTDATTLTYLGVNNNYYICEITGIKVGSGSGSVSEQYDENETVVGKWIDGKPIYQITYVPESTLYTNGRAWVDTGLIISYIGKIIDWEIVAYDTYVNAVANVKIALFRYNNNNVQINVNGDWYLDIQAITIKYTKTTD